MLPATRWSSSTPSRRSGPGRERAHLVVAGGRRRRGARRRRPRCAGRRPTPSRPARRRARLPRGCGSPRATRAFAPDDRATARRGAAILGDARPSSTAARPAARARARGGSACRRPRTCPAGCGSASPARCARAAPPRRRRARPASPVNPDARCSTRRPGVASRWGYWAAVRSGPSIGPDRIPPGGGVKRSSRSARARPASTSPACA